MVSKNGTIKRLT